MDFEKAFDEEQFRKHGHALVDLLADQYKASKAGEGKVTNWHSPDEELDFWSNYAMKEDPTDFFKTVLKRSINLHNPNYIGHQVASVVPFTTLTNLLQGYLNNGTAVFEMGAAGVAMERLVSEDLAKKIGYPDTADGFLTSGGTLANLTALLTARAVKAPTVWNEGASKQLGIMVSEEAHYCVERAIRIMGLGAKGMILLPTDSTFSVSPDQLEATYQKALEDGIQPIAVVGSACSTSTGSYDPLDALADFAEKHDLWFHVDGAHGAAVCYASSLKHKIKGIERADSMILDWHKMFMVPNLATSVLYKNGIEGHKTFLAEAKYLWSNNGEVDWYNVGKRTFECTKSIIGLRVYFHLNYHGDAFFADYLENMYGLAKDFYKHIQASTDFESPVDPAANIVCFRHLAEGQDLNVFNQKIRQQLLEEGRFYIVSTKLNGDTYLRVTIINPHTGWNHLKDLLAYIRKLGTEIKGE